MNGTGAQSLRRMSCSGSPDVQTLTSGNSWNTLQMQVLDGLFSLRVPSVTYEADAFVLQHAALHNLTIGREDLFKLSRGNIPIELTDEESALLFLPVLFARLIGALTAGRCDAFRFSSRLSPGTATTSSRTASAARHTAFTSTAGVTASTSVFYLQTARRVSGDGGNLGLRIASSGPLCVQRLIPAIDTPIFQGIDGRLGGDRCRKLNKATALARENLALEHHTVLGQLLLNLNDEGPKFRVATRNRKLADKDSPLLSHALISTRPPVAGRLYRGVGVWKGPDWLANHPGPPCA
mmetsp:Transcript_56054/g.149548  ORF Transcript_56054/g.149548 Transcript_56054/m.149548 type:complete len:294 (+) Transcript_56054:110-991(+)